MGVAVCTLDERISVINEKLTDTQLQLRCEEQKKKAEDLINRYGGKIYDSYQELVESNEIDAIYIPLPPALHYMWAKRCLERGKHVLLEKPFTIDIEQTCELLRIAKRNKRAVCENYMFIYHDQVQSIKEIIQSGLLGKIRLYDAKFGFPRRKANDFRYNKSLGGGALLDCGGYLLKGASIFLGNDYKILYGCMNFTGEYNVDIYGSASLLSNNNEVMNIAYGMDNAYRCELRIWGNDKILETERFFTAPPQLKPVIRLVSSDGSTEEIVIRENDTFQKSIIYFEECIKDPIKREQSYMEIEMQAEHVKEFLEMSSLLVEKGMINGKQDIR